MPYNLKQTTSMPQMIQVFYIEGPDNCFIYIHKTPAYLTGSKCWFHATMTAVSDLKTIKQK